MGETEQVINEDALFTQLQAAQQEKLNKANKELSEAIQEICKKYKVELTTAYEVINGQAGPVRLYCLPARQ